MVLRFVDSMDVRIFLFAEMRWGSSGLASEGFDSTEAGGRVWWMVGTKVGIKLVKLGRWRADAHTLD